MRSIDMSDARRAIAGEGRETGYHCIAVKSHRAAITGRGGGAGEEGKNESRMLRGISYQVSPSPPPGRPAASRIQRMQRVLLLLLLLPRRNISRKKKRAAVCQKRRNSRANVYPQRMLFHHRI
jgi:hypothetical protein